jgi:hypothetical protein
VFERAVMRPHVHLPGFLSPEEVRRFDRLVEGQSDLFNATGGRGGLGPKYKVIDGDQIRARLPEIERLGETRVKPLVEQIAGAPVQPFGSSKRSIRVQVYSNPRDGFRWHFDGHSFAALLTLRNANRGETQIVPERLSRLLRFPLYPLYAFPQLFSLAPHERIAMGAGDLLFIRGGRVLHRGVTLGATGERVQIVYSYDEAGKKPNRIRDFVARTLNY